MKLKIRLKDNITGKDKVGEISVPNKAHLKAQMTYKSRVFDLKKYKKPKHKKKIYEEE